MDVEGYLYLGTLLQDKHAAASPELHNKIIITSVKPFPFSFHVSFNQHCVVFVTSLWVGSKP